MEAAAKHLLVACCLITSMMMYEAHIWPLIITSDDRTRIPHTHIRTIHEWVTLRSGNVAPMTIKRLYTPMYGQTFTLHAMQQENIHTATFQWDEITLKDNGEMRAALSKRHTESACVSSINKRRYAINCCWRYATEVVRFMDGVFFFVGLLLRASAFCSFLIHFGLFLLGKHNNHKGNKRTTKADICFSFHSGLAVSFQWIWNDSFAEHVCLCVHSISMYELCCALAMFGGDFGSV